MLPGDGDLHHRRTKVSIAVFFVAANLGDRRPQASSVARLEGFEPPTHGLEVRCSIQLSYRRIGSQQNSRRDRVSHSCECLLHLSEFVFATVQSGLEGGGVS